MVMPYLIGLLVVVIIGGFVCAVVQYGEDF